MTSAEVSPPRWCAVSRYDIAQFTDGGSGYFAGTVGVQRVLKLLKKYDIKATWFIPGHSLETFPEDMSGRARCRA